MLETIHLALPATTDDLRKLKIGTVAYLSGRIFTAREGAYKHAIEEGAGMPAGGDALGRANFHCSPGIAAHNNKAASFVNFLIESSDGARAPARSGRTTTTTKTTPARISQAVLRAYYLRCFAQLRMASGYASRSAAKTRSANV